MNSEGADIEGHTTICECAQRVTSAASRCCLWCMRTRSKLLAELSRSRAPTRYRSFFKKLIFFYVYFFFLQRARTHTFHTTTHLCEHMRMHVTLLTFKLIPVFVCVCVCDDSVSECVCVCVYRYIYIYIYIIYTEREREREREKESEREREGT